MPVNRRLLAVLALVLALAVLVVSAPAGATDDPTKCTAAAVLKAANEVPPTASKALGAAVVHVNGTKLSFAWRSRTRRGRRSSPATSTWALRE